MYISHPLRPIALECINNEENERPSAVDLCRRLVQLKATAEYANSFSQYNEKVLAIPLTKSANEMRNKEIAVLDNEIKTLTQKKKRLQGVFFRKKDTSKLDGDIADLEQKKKPLVANREIEEAEERRRIEYENENTQLKAQLEKLVTENTNACIDNIELKKYMKQLEKDKEEAITEQVMLHKKIAELKQIIHNYLEKEEKERQESKNKEDFPFSHQKLKVSILEENVSHNVVILSFHVAFSFSKVIYHRYSFLLILC